MTNPHAGWAPVVHGRTYRVDFRPHLLVVPDWFTDDDIAVVREFARVSTRSAENLTDGPRWLMVRTARFQVAGVTCMAAAVSTDMTYDRPDPGSGGTGRPLYVFLGWATRDLAADPPPMDVEFYKQLYQFVRKRWDNAPPDEAADAVGPLVERFPPVPRVSEIERLTRDPDKLGSENPILSVWPDSLRETLWMAAARHTGPVSLCLGMARSRDAEDSPLGNITVAGSDKSFTHKRTPKPATGTTDRYTNTGHYEAGSFANDRPYPRPAAEGRASGSPRRQSAATGVSEFVVDGLQSLMRMIGIGGHEEPKTPPGSSQTAPPVVSLGEVLRPVRPSAGRPKANAFDAFDEPPQVQPDAIPASSQHTTPSHSQASSAVHGTASEVESRPETETENASQTQPPPQNPAVETHAKSGQQGIPKPSGVNSPLPHKPPISPSTFPRAYGKTIPPRMNTPTNDELMKKRLQENLDSATEPEDETK